MAYSHVQQLRAKSRTLVANSPSNNELNAAIDVLRTALVYLDDRAVKDLSAANAALFYRGLDVRVDLAELYVRSNKLDLALLTLEQIKVQYWFPGLRSYLTKTKIFAALEHEPRFQALLKVSVIPERLYENNAIASDFRPTLTLAERVAGVSVFWHQVRSDFAFFDNVPDLDWGRTYLEYLSAVEKTVSTEDYYRVLMRLAAQLKDGHTNIYPPDELSSKFDAKPPVQTALIEDKVVVTGVRSDQLKSTIGVGDEIVSIDGVPVKSYAERFVAPYVSSSTPQDRDVRQYSYRLLSGDEDKPVRLGLRSPSGVSREVVLERKGYRNLSGSHASAFKLLPGNVAYISVADFESDEGAKLLEKSFPALLKSNGLIIDVRNNGGGSGWYGVRLLQLLTNSPIPGMNSYGRGDTGLRREDGSVIEWIRLPSNATEKGSRQIFSGPVVVLTGAKTFSAAEDFVAAFKQVSRGKTIGGSTGGSTGQPVLVKLPGGGVGRICAKRDVYSDGTTFVGKGIVPDVQVSQTLVDLYAGRDTILERALAEIKIIRP